MPHSGIRSFVRCIAILGVCLTFLALCALPALAEEPDPAAAGDAIRQAALEQAAATRQAAIEQADTVAANMPGVGSAGPAIIIDIDPIVIQKDIVIDASVGGSGGPVSQTTGNDLSLAQSNSATAGTPAASGGGIAISGGAVSGTVAVVTQINVAVVAGFVPAGGVTQDATNSTALDQTAAAKGGNATATGAGAIATGGAADALVIGRVSQFNTLWFVGTDPDATDPVSQVAANAAGLSQNASATAGSATAAAGAQASSGKASDTDSTTIEQLNLIRNW